MPTPTPAQIAAQLRKIAAGIDNSSLPDRIRVSADIRRVLALLLDNTTPSSSGPSKYVKVSWMSGPGRFLTDDVLPEHVDAFIKDEAEKRGGYNFEVDGKPHPSPLPKF